MNENVVQALALISVAAVMNATYTLPMKLNRRWAWEHSWLAFTVLGVLVVPAAVAWLTVPGLWSIYGETPASTLTKMALFGAGWGVSQVLFGLAVDAVGVGITFAVSLGTSAASGALIPLVTQHSDRIFTAQGLLILAGVAGVLGGVALFGVAGRQREMARVRGSAPGPSRFASGFLFALLSGTLGSLLNVGLSAGTEIQQAAARNGAGPAMMSNAVWLPCLAAGFVPGVLYCLFLMRRRRTLSDFAERARPHYYLMAISMGVLWFGSIVLYGLSAVKLGDLGPVIGWPLFMSAIVIASTVAGLWTGEWKEAGRGPVRIMAGAVAVLLVAMGVLSAAGV